MRWGTAGAAHVSSTLAIGRWLLLPAQRRTDERERCVRSRSGRNEPTSRAREGGGRRRRRAGTLSRTQSAARAACSVHSSRSRHLAPSACSGVWSATEALLFEQATTNHLILPATFMCISPHCPVIPNQTKRQCIPEFRIPRFEFRNSAIHSIAE